MLTAAGLVAVLGAALTDGGPAASAVDAPSEGVVEAAADASVTPTLVKDAEIVTGPDAPCSDAIVFEPSAGEIQVQRTGPTGIPLEVSYTVGGSAEPGHDYEALPGTLTIAAGADRASILVTPLNVSSSSTVTVTVTAGDGYQPGSPASVTVRITSRTQNLDCGPPTVGDTSAWSRQTIRLGERPASFPVVPFAGTTAPAYVASGTLPPGVTLQVDGSFAGGANAIRYV